MTQNRAKKRAWDTEKGEVITKQQITDFVLRVLARKSLSEKELLKMVYLQFNENLPASILITLKNRKLITHTEQGWVFLQIIPHGVK